MLTNLGFLCLYLIFGLIVSCVTYKIKYVKDKENIGFIFIFWPVFCFIMLILHFPYLFDFIGCLIKLIIDEIGELIIFVADKLLRGKV